VVRLDMAVVGQPEPNEVSDIEERLVSTSRRSGHELTPRNSTLGSSPPAAPLLMVFVCAMWD